VSPTLCVSGTYALSNSSRVARSPDFLRKGERNEASLHIAVARLDAAGRVARGRRDGGPGSGAARSRGGRIPYRGIPSLPRQYLEGAAPRRQSGAGEEHPTLRLVQRHLVRKQHARRALPDGQAVLQPLRLHLLRRRHEQVHVL
jgi:hypothetical protein